MNAMLSISIEENQFLWMFGKAQCEKWINLLIGFKLQYFNTISI